LLIDRNKAGEKKLAMPLMNIYGRFQYLLPPEACAGIIGAVGFKDTEKD
jgi:polyhydroxyalkanoate synthase